jgi:hypothetical protein
VAVAGTDAVFGFGQGVAVGIVDIADPALLGQAIIVVIAVGGVDTVNDGIGAVTDVVVLVFRAVVAVDRIGDLLFGQAVQVIVGVIRDSSVILKSSVTPARYSYPAYKN